MIKNFWEFAKFYCMNHEQPIPMTVREGDSAFYACPRYMLKDERHPDGHEENEKMCVNRISFTSATSIMERFMKYVDADNAAGNIVDYTGFRFNFNGIEAKVLKYDPNDVRIGILNRRAVK